MEDNQQQDQQIETVSKEEFDAVVAERDDLLQFKPKELSDEEKAFQTREQELFNREVQLEIKSAGLEKFAEFISVESKDDLAAKIEKFQSVLNDFKVENSYVPTEHKANDPYSKFEADKNTKGMIGSKLASLFKN